jgi:phosphosulfolactate synthase (CoM biosynthesis protein A)
MGPDVDGIKLAGGSALAMQRQAVVDLIDTAHEHGAYAGSLEYVLQKVWPLIIA